MSELKVDARVYRELDFLRQQCANRKAPELPAVVCEWFDVNRSSAPDPTYAADLLRRIQAAKVDLGNWTYHTDAYGWQFLMQPYKRDGVVYYLVCVSRDDKPTRDDIAMRDKLLAHLGGDATVDFLMHTRGDDDRDVQDFWTWRAVKLTSSTATA